MADCQEQNYWYQCVQLSEQKCVTSVGPTDRQDKGRKRVCFGRRENETKRQRRASQPLPQTERLATIRRDEVLVLTVNGVCAVESEVRLYGPHDDGRLLIAKEAGERKKNTQSQRC